MGVTSDYLPTPFILTRKSIPTNNVVAGDHQEQIILCPAQRDIEEAPRVGFVWEVLSVARHDNYAATLKPLCFVDGAYGLPRRLGARICTVVSNLGHTIQGCFDTPKLSGFPELLGSVNSDIGESVIRHPAREEFVGRLVI